jgi:two-component system sensor histidine kinase DesK
MQPTIVASDSAAAEDAPSAAGTPDRSPAGQQRLTGGWLFGPLLALVFLGYPIQTAFVVDPTPERLLLTLGGAALFGGGFVWLLWTGRPFPSAPVETAEVTQRRVAVTCLAALVVSLNIGLARGPEWLVLFFHTSAASGLLLPRGDAYAAVAMLAAVAAVVGSRVDLAFVALPTAAVGLWAIAFSGQVAAVAELRAARVELARRAVAEERLRFARDLHDLLGHSLSLITLKNELAGRLLPDEPEQAAHEVKDAEEVARRALREVREAVAGYRQPTLGEELIGAREMLAAAGIACTVENGGAPLPRRVDALLAWAVREGVTNVIRHSRARRCTIRIARADGSATAEIADDGRGSPPERGALSNAPGGSGLAGLAERVADVSGAAFEAGPVAGGGFVLRVSLPLEEYQP